MKKLNKLFVIIMMLAGVPAFAADEAQVQVEIDRQEVSLDDSVSMKFSVKSGTGLVQVDPEFSAPGFEVINEYSNTFVESYYENGRFGARNTQQITKVLKPMKTGSLKITGIQVKVGGKVYTHPGIEVQVVSAGGGTPPPTGYGGAGMGLRGSGKRVSKKAFFVRAEVDKQKVFKGEQIVVSYYLYQSARTFNIMVDKYPTLNGFLREELEMPVLGQRLDHDNVVLDGVPYARSLLVRYAAYPLKDGKLTIDPMSLKASYYGGGQQAFDDDPFAQFFQQLAPRSGSSRSEPLTVESIPLPGEGRPDTFSGGVGDFTVTSAVDRYDVRANEAVTLTLKIEGKGNVAAIQEPKTKWPDNVELYEAKGEAKTGKGGVGAKTFEFLLIPRVSGKVVLPGISVSFFDPNKKMYTTHSTEPIEINVAEAAPGSAAVSPGKRPSAQQALDPAANAVDDFHYLKASGDSNVGFQGYPWWRWLYWLSVLGFVCFVGFVLFDKIQGRFRGMRSTREAKALANSKSWQRLRLAARKASDGIAWNEVTATYELLCGAVYDVLDEAYDVGSRSLSRSALREALVNEKGLSSEIWKRVEQLLEFAEMVRFASSAGVVSEAAARTQLARWVAEGEIIAGELADKL